MKSPLVKALSQASGDDGRSEPPVESPPAVTDEQQLPDPGELQLMESAQVLRVDDGISLAPDGPSGIANDESDVEFGAALLAKDDQPANEEAGFAGEALIDVPAIAASTMTSRRLWIRRFGNFSPLICIVLSFAASGCYLAYQTLAGWHQNSDLRALSNQNRSSLDLANDSNKAGGATRNPFELAVGPSARATKASAAAVPFAVPMAAPTAASSPKPRATTIEFKDAAVDDKAFSTLNEAYDAYELGNYAAAESAYLQALEIAPRHPNALQGLAALLHRTGRFDESRQYYESLLSVDPDNAAAAAALLAAGEEAQLVANESEIKQLVQRHPNSAALQFSLGQLLAKQSRWADARDAFASATRLDDNNSDYLFNLAISLEQLGLYAEAKRFYESALASSTASSTLNSDFVVARIESLSVHTDVESESR